MQIRSTSVIIFTHLLLSAAIFGFFYSYACSVMIGLDFADATTAIKAMQAINLTIKNPWFAPAFFGPLVTGLIAAWMLYNSNVPKSSIALLIATGIYFLGAFLPTILFSVPLNDKLGLITSTEIASNSVSIWWAYSTEWKSWNLLRTIGSALALLVSTFALTQHRPQTGDQQ